MESHQGAKPKENQIKKQQGKTRLIQLATARSESSPDPLSYLQRSHENDPNRRIRLLNLAAEVFKEITSWLEPDSLTCLSLTCTAVLDIVGRDSWIECHSKQQCYDPTKHSWLNFRSPLIPLLGRDAQHLTVCNVCLALHPQIKPPREHRVTKLTKHCFGQWSVIDYLPNDKLGGYHLLWEHIPEARKSLTPDSAFGWKVHRAVQEAELHTEIVWTTNREEFGTQA